MSKPDCSTVLYIVLEANSFFIAEIILQVTDLLQPVPYRGILLHLIHVIVNLGLLGLFILFLLTTGSLAWFPNFLRDSF